MIGYARVSTEDHRTLRQVDEFNMKLTTGMAYMDPGGGAAFA